MKEGFNINCYFTDAPGIAIPGQSSYYVIVQATANVSCTASVGNPVNVEYIFTQSETLNL